MRPVDAEREVEAEVMISLMVQQGTETHVAGGIELSVSGDPWGLVGREGASLSARPKAGEGTLTVEPHVMVGEDSWAVPLGGAPDHHVQKAVRRLDVMFLEGRDHAGPSGQPPTPGSSGKRGWGAAWGLLGLWWDLPPTIGWASPSHQPQLPPERTDQRAHPSPRMFSTGAT